MSYLWIVSVEFNVRINNNIRPLLEYNTIIWNPTLTKHADAIEQIQRSFTKRIPSLSTLSYLQRLNELKLDTLEVRRLHQDLIYYYKIQSINQSFVNAPYVGFNKSNRGSGRHVIRPNSTRSCCVLLISPSSS